jgi:hypothetical protein
MSFRFSAQRSIDQRSSRRLKVVASLLGLFVLFISAFSIQTSLQADTKKKGRRPVNIQTESGIELLPLEKAQLPEINRIDRRGRLSSISPLAIPAGTSLNSVAFFGIDLTSSVKAVADTNGDLIPDSTATEDFIQSADPENEIISALAFSRKSGRFYAGVAIAGGRRLGNGDIIVFNNPSGNFQGNKLGMFTSGAGTPIGMAVIDGPNGDILIVASVEFVGANFLAFNAADNLRITAYLPGASGFPDGTQKMDILPAGSKLGQNVINRSFGGMTVDEKGNLFVNIATRTSGSLGGAILVFKDANGDSVPEMGSVFASGSQTDLNAITATSIVALGGGRLAALGISVFQGQTDQIVIYNDADGNLVADGPPTVFATLPEQFTATIFSFGTGSSTAASAQLDFADGQALFSFVTLNSSNAITDSGAAIVKEGGAPVKIFEAAKSGDSFGVLTFVKGIPRATDNTPPTVKVNMPNGGETVSSGTQLAISFTSSDTVGVASHDIGLSTDGGTTFPISVATGLSGSTQSFNFVIPAAIGTTTARVRVTAKDAAGNTAFDDSDANFTIMRSANADTVNPTVTISAPTAGSTLNANAMTTVSFTSTDNVGVVSHNVLFASNGTDFTTTLATGLAGTATSFQFRVPAVASTTAAIRVEAVDAAGNKGTATVSNLTVRNDSTKPTVTVTSPKAKDKPKRNTQITVSFTSSDDVGVASHEIQLSRDNGATFSPLATGVPGNVQSFQVTLPNEKVKKAVIKVIARDAAGNTGEGVSGVFKIK